MALIKFENEDKLFIKFFLLDSSVNLNTWGVTRKAMLNGLKSFISSLLQCRPRRPEWAQSGHELAQTIPWR